VPRTIGIRKKTLWYSGWRSNNLREFGTLDGEFG
jgi:hypothetical protein